MTVPESSIFRKKPDRHYQASEQTVLPHFVSNTAFVCLWILTALLVAGGLAAWNAFLPPHSRSPIIRSLETKP